MCEIYTKRNDSIFSLLIILSRLNYSLRKVKSKRNITYFRKLQSNSFPVIILYYVCLSFQNDNEYGSENRLCSTNFIRSRNRIVLLSYDNAIYTRLVGSLLKKRSITIAIGEHEQQQVSEEAPRCLQRERLGQITLELLQSAYRLAV